MRFSLLFYGDPFLLQGLSFSPKQLFYSLPRTNIIHCKKNDSFIEVGAGHRPCTPLQGKGAITCHTENFAQNKMKE